MTTETQTHRYAGSCTAGPRRVKITHEETVEVGTAAADDLTRARLDGAGIVVTCAVCGGLHMLERAPDDATIAELEELRTDAVPSPPAELLEPEPADSAPTEELTMPDALEPGEDPA